MKSSTKVTSYNGKRGQRPVILCILDTPIPTSRSQEIFKTQCALEFEKLWIAVSLIVALPRHGKTTEIGAELQCNSSTSTVEWLSPMKTNAAFLHKRWALYSWLDVNVDADVCYLGGEINDRNPMSSQGSFREPVLC